MSSKLLSILTSPFWGPKKLDEIYAAAEKNLETADKLSNETAENLKKTEELYQQISAFQEQQKNVSDAQKEQISQGMDTLKSLMEMLQQSAAGLAEDRKTAKELQANYEKTLHSEISAILSEIKKTSELDRQNISDAKQQVVSNNQTVQALINSANNIISGLKNAIVSRILRIVSSKVSSLTITCKLILFSIELYSCSIASTFPQAMILEIEVVQRFNAIAARFFCCSPIRIACPCFSAASCKINSACLLFSSLSSNIFSADAKVFSEKS